MLDIALAAIVHRLIFAALLVVVVALRTPFGLAVVLTAVDIVVDCTVLVVYVVEHRTLPAAAVENLARTH